ncbi:hypothetical protein [Franconibacter helveticus]|uniref:hypothetical protein n=1 Tax=Franconibacter helveticus TaxID=357240 RepID=UPI000DA1DC12|nr:hypothetical protein [Franconibacter helveticus]
MRISIVFTYNAQNRDVVKSWIQKAVGVGCREIITVNEGDAPEIHYPHVININVTNPKNHHEPLAMAIGAHYAQGDAVILCRNGDSLTHDVLSKAGKAEYSYVPFHGICICPRSSFPWRYDIDPGFKRGKAGEFFGLKWEISDESAHPAF